MTAGQKLLQVVACIGLAFASAIRNDQPKPAPKVLPPASQTSSVSVPAKIPQPSTEQRFVQLRDSYQLLTSHRAALNLADVAAVDAFNREATRYHDELHNAQLAFIQETTFSSPPILESYPMRKDYFVPTIYSMPHNYPMLNLGGNYGSSTTRVSGYLRSNGTYLSPYLRTKADTTTYNNWSHTGNINPITGAKGYHK